MFIRSMENVNVFVVTEVEKPFPGNIFGRWGCFTFVGLGVDWNRYTAMKKNQDRPSRASATPS